MKRATISARDTVYQGRAGRVIYRDRQGCLLMLFPTANDPDPQPMAFPTQDVDFVQERRVGS